MGNTVSIHLDNRPSEKDALASIKMLRDHLKKHMQSTPTVRSMLFQLDEAADVLEFPNKES